MTHPKRFLPAAVAMMAIGVGLMISGCARQSDLDKINTNLGDYRYVGLCPKVDFKILKIEVVKAANEYGRPRLNVTGIARQNGSFPLAHYTAGMQITVYSENNKIGTGQLSGAMKDGNMAFSDSVYLEECEPGETIKISSIRIEKGLFIWWPAVSSTPADSTLEIVR